MQGAISDRRNMLTEEAPPVTREAPRSNLIHIFLLLAMTAILAYGVLTVATPVAQQDRLTRESRNLYLIALGALGLLGTLFSRRAKSERARRDPVIWLAMLLPVYAVIQLCPLPLRVLRTLSPARAGLLDALAPLSLEPRWASLSAVPTITLTHLLLIAGYAVVFFFIRDVALSNGSAAWLPILLLLGIAAWQAIWGISQFVTHDSGGIAHGSYPIRNHYAGLLEMLLPLGVAYGAKEIHRIRHGDFSVSRMLQFAAGLSVAALALGGILYSLSRMGLISSAAAMATVAILAVAGQVRGVKKGIAMLSVGSVVTVLIALLAPAPLILRFAGPDNRWPVWQDTTHLIAAYPVFGTGLGGYESAFTRFNTSQFTLVQDYAHNDYLQFLAELGGIGFLIAAALFSWILSRSVRAALRHPDHDRRWLGVACSAALVAILLHSFVDFNLYVPANATVLAWICGLASTLTLPTATTQRTRVSEI
jgi:O-antigen ligase